MSLSFDSSSQSFTDITKLFKEHSCLAEVFTLNKQIDTYIQIQIFSAKLNSNSNFLKPLKKNSKNSECLQAYSRKHQEYSAVLFHKEYMDQLKGKQIWTHLNADSPEMPCSTL